MEGRLLLRLLSGTPVFPGHLTYPRNEFSVLPGCRISAPCERIYLNERIVKSGSQIRRERGRISNVPINCRVAVGGKNQDEQLLSLEDTLQFQEDTSNSLSSRRYREDDLAFPFDRNGMNGTRFRLQVSLDGYFFCGILSEWRCWFFESSMSHRRR